MLQQTNFNFFFFSWLWVIVPDGKKVPSGKTASPSVCPIMGGYFKDWVYISLIVSS